MRERERESEREWENERERERERAAAPNYVPSLDFSVGHVLKGGSVLIR